MKQPEKSEKELRAELAQIILQLNVVQPTDFAQQLSELSKKRTK